MKDILLKNRYLKINLLKKKIRKLMKKKDISNIIRENIDNKFLKFIQIKKYTIIFRANKKLRDEMEKNPKFLIKYINKFLSEVLEEEITIDKKELSIITQISYFEDDNKIYIEF